MEKTTSPAPSEEHGPREEHHKEPPRGYSTYDGFKSFAHNGTLSVEDIVKSLSHMLQAVPKNVEQIYEGVEPIYENVEPVTTDTAAEANGVPPHIRNFTSALVGGDRLAVFVGLREHVHVSGRPEQLLSATVCLLDDVYRARIDGSPCDAEFARLTARLSTTTLERFITALTTAVDSSYSDSVTGAKLALIRALAVLGA